ncbi:hypothetical protein FQN54_002582 [Arachnomyces sp. PD_36]|nr:hypothetical protein FQN54_002582 [Arachnomyces sp. PD_36]
MAKLSERVDQMVKDGKLSADDGKLLLYKADIIRRILSIYNHIAKSPVSSVTTERLAQADIKIIPWSTDTPRGQKPIFFKQMALDDFNSCEMPRMSSIYPPLDSREFAYAAKARLSRCLNYFQPPTRDETLPEMRGWRDYKYNSESLSGGGDDVTPGRQYEWKVFHILAQATVPHMVVCSMHVSEDSTRILQDELTILLKVIWGVARETWLRAEVTPVLLVSMHNFQFRITEAYYDGSKLIARQSNPVPMRLTDSPEDQLKTVNWVLRWASSTPLGETKSFSSISALGREEAPS